MCVCVQCIQACSKTVSNFVVCSQIDRRENYFVDNLIAEKIVDGANLWTEVQIVDRAAICGRKHKLWTEAQFVDGAEICGRSEKGNCLF